MPVITPLATGNMAAPKARNEPKAKSNKAPIRSVPTMAR